MKFSLHITFAILIGDLKDVTKGENLEILFSLVNTNFLEPYGAKKEYKSFANNSLMILLLEFILPQSLQYLLPSYLL